MQAIKADVIFFDFDGTLVNTLNAIVKATNYSLKENSLPQQQPQDIIALLGIPLHDILKRLLKINDFKLIDQVVQDQRKKQLTLTGDYEIYPGVAETLKALKAEGKKLVIVTAKPLNFVEKYLKEKKLLSLFEPKMFGNIMKPGVEEKPKNNLIAQALKAHQNVRAVMVGDSIYDMQGAHENGLKGVAVTYGAGKRKDLEKVKTEVIIDRFSQLLEVIQ